MQLIRRDDWRRRQERLRSIANAIGINPLPAAAPTSSSGSGPGSGSLASRSFRGGQGQQQDVSTSNGANDAAAVGGGGFEDVRVVIGELRAVRPNDIRGKIDVLNKFLSYSSVSDERASKRARGWFDSLTV